MALSFKPEQARVPPALQMPIPPITKVPSFFLQNLIFYCNLIFFFGMWD